MTELPPDELAALPDKIAPGTTVLELGNKKNVTGLYRDWYLDQGLDYVCVDWNGKDGALVRDMRDYWEPDEIMNGMERGFAVVTNFGFTEHVGVTYLEQLTCWRNVNNFVGVGGYLCICMPIMPDWKGHGTWMPTPQWYMEFARINGYVIEKNVIWDRVRRTCVMRLKKVEKLPWSVPVEVGDVKILRSDM
jgi:hypothetical protein